jgi:hypothetical protein
MEEEMKKKIVKTLIRCSGLFLFFFIQQTVSGQSHTVDIGVGSLQISVNTAFADRSKRLVYPREYNAYERRGWSTKCVNGGGIIIGAKNFQCKAHYPEGFPVGTLPEQGWTVSDTLFSYYVVDATSMFTYDTKHTTVPVAGAHKKYWKYYPPTRIVNNEDVSTKSWTTYDVLDENMLTEQMGLSMCHTSMGITVTERAYVFANQAYDDFAIVEYIFKNTGETGSSYADGTPITYATNVLEDCYVGVKFWPIISETNVVPNSSGWKEGTDDWVDYAHSDNGDVLRVMYGWDGDAGNDYQSADDEGDPLVFTSGIFLSDDYPGMAVLHADKAPDNPENDMNQPYFSYVSYNGYQSPNTLTLNRSFSMEDIYKRLESGDQLVPPLDWDLWKNSQTEDWLRGTRYATEQYNQIGTLAFGPYQFNNIGDSVRVVLCFTVGSIGWEKAIDLGAKWKDNLITPTEKNVILRSGRDSLFAKVKAVKELFQKGTGNYDFTIQSIAEKIKAPPAWPDSIILSSAIGGCSIQWAPVSGANAYRVYRRSRVEFSVETPSTDPVYELVYQCGGDDPGDGVEYSSTIDSTRWIDQNTSITRNYWYYVTVVNDEGIESSHFMTRTNPTRGDPLYGSVTPFEKPPYSLDSIYVVPNPYHSKSIKLYDRDENILTFVGLPASCRIRIFTQSGVLIETIDHELAFPPSSSENWQMRTSNDQTIASGLYFYIIDQARNHEDEPINSTKVDKFVVIR